ncbi:MAG: high potential iron sulfur protein [Roseiarcus sp.]|jgi:hypothetical protein
MSKSEGMSGVNRRDLVLAAVGAAPLLALSSTIAEAKMAQTAVGYQDEPKDGKQCNGCNFYIDPNACKVVDGEIKPTGYCKLWNKKAAS